MNWYKIAQNRTFPWENVEGIAYSQEAINDLANFKKSQNNKNVRAIVTLIKEKIDTRELNLRHVESRPAANPHVPNAPKENIKLYIFEPRGVGLAWGSGKGYRICAQQCPLDKENKEIYENRLQEQKRERSGKKFLIIKRIFENHDEDYVPWISLYNESHVDDCPKYKLKIQQEARKEKAVLLNVQNPFDWLSSSVKMLRERNVEGARQQKMMLEGKSAEDLLKVLDYIKNHYTGYARGDIMLQIEKWIEEYMDRLG